MFFFSPQEKRGGESLSLLLLLIRLDYIFLKKEDEKVAKAPFLLGKDSQNRYRSHAAFLYTTAWWENKFQHLHDYLEMDWGEKNQNIFKMFRLTFI